MGVPAFFKWLITKCPKIIQDATEPASTSVIDEIIEIEEQIEENGNPVIDNLYLDMNGIIHPCTHPENKGIPLPLNEEDMFNNIFAYTDRIMKIIKPRKLLFIAIDGVAPRAKMNQQRGRRFKAAQEAKRSQELKEQLRQKFIQEGKNSTAMDNFVNNTFDHNVITPGTPFMDRLVYALNLYIQCRMNEDPNFKDIKVMLTDSNQPGEGEHKILEYIRLQRAQPDYDPNTRHCLYGADADLIMLGLATHEAHFYIFREALQQPAERRCNLCGQEGHFGYECKGEARRQEDDLGNAPKKQIIVSFQFIKLYVFREYLDLTFKTNNLSFGYNLERIIDDFVFMCFFVGNDFLPHIPSLNIRDGGIDQIIFLYQRILGSLGGYLTQNGELNLMRVDVLIQQIGGVEEAVLKQQQKDDDFHKQRRLQQQGQNQNQSNQQLNMKRNLSSDQSSHSNIASSATQINKELIAKKNTHRNNTFAGNAKIVHSDSELPVTQVLSSKKKKKNFNKEAAERLKLELFPINESLDDNEGQKNNNEDKYHIKKKVHVDVNSAENNQQYQQTNNISTKNNSNSNISNILSQDNQKFNQNQKQKQVKQAQKIQNEEDDIITDTDDARIAIEFAKQLKDISEAKRQENSKRLESEYDNETLKLHQNGFKQRYYGKKFHINSEDFFEFKDKIMKAYVEGLCWVFAYYYKGCISWNWFYPFHYAPFASDLEGLDNIAVRFEIGQPFRPIDQLLAVLSPLSAKNVIPECLCQLMVDKDSPIIDFYPTDFFVDTEKKKVEWLGEVLLPFIDEERLLAEISKYLHLLTPIEMARNQYKGLIMYSHSNSQFCKKVDSLNSIQLLAGGERVEAVMSHAEFGMCGKVYRNNKDKLTKIIVQNSRLNLQSIEESHVQAFHYENPPFIEHVCDVLKGAEFPSGCLNINLIEEANYNHKQGQRMIRTIQFALGGNNQRPNYMRNNNTSNTNVNNNFNNAPQTAFTNKFARDPNYYNEFNNNNRRVNLDPVEYKSKQVQQQHYIQDNSYMLKIQQSQPSQTQTVFKLNNQQNINQQQQQSAQFQNQFQARPIQQIQGQRQQVNRYQQQYYQGNNRFELLSQLQPPTNESVEEQPGNQTVYNQNSNGQNHRQQSKNANYQQNQN